MEIVDLFVINKANLHGFGRLKALLKELVMITATDNYEVPIVKTITIENKGIDKLWEKLKTHHQYLYSTKEGKQKRIFQQELEVYELIREEIWRDVQAFIEKRHAIQPIEADTDPYQLARDWYARWKQEGGWKGNAER